MALIEGCKHSLEISIPVAEVDSETNRAVSDVQKRAKLPGFRPGKAPASIIRKQFDSEIRRKVLDAGVVVETGDRTKQGTRRPAMLYRFAQRDFEFR